MIEEEVDGDVLERAIELAREIVSGKTKVRTMEMGPMPNVPDSLPPVDIGHLSQAIDKLIVQAILQGGKMPLEKGLKNEAKLHGQCWNTEDTRIGLKNFIENGAAPKRRLCTDSVIG